MQAIDYSSFENENWLKSGHGNTSKKAKSDTYTPPESARNNAKRVQTTSNGSNGVPAALDGARSARYPP